MATRKKRLAPIHPGEILQEDVLRPMNLSVAALANAIHVPTARISGIVSGRRPMTADTALRLARYFSTSARFWLNLQISYDLEIAGDELAHKIRQVRRRR